MVTKILPKRFFGLRSVCSFVYPVFERYEVKLVKGEISYEVSHEDRHVNLGKLDELKHLNAVDERPEKRQRKT